MSEPETTTASVIAEECAGATGLLVAFGGIGGEIGVPRFEFSALTADIRVNRLFVRDLRQAWYHDGIPGIGGSIHAIAEYLRLRIAELQPRRVVFIGNSMGGYAAIALGSLVGVDAVHAFSPQVFIGPVRRFVKRDHRWRTQIRRGQTSPGADSSLFDLRRTVAARPSRTKITVYYSHSDRLDTRHARRLRHLQGVELRGFAKGGHALVKELRNSGELKQIIRLEFDEERLARDEMP